MDQIIAPSLLSANFLDLKSEIEVLNKATNIWYHLDIMDGHFVPNLTFGPTVFKNLKLISKHPLDAHFMVENPGFFAGIFKDIGLDNFTFHWEAETHHDRLIQHLKTLYPSVGISLNPSTSLSVIPEYLLKQVDLVLLMSVNPGFGGQSFISSVGDKVKELATIRERISANFKIQVDGGVNGENAKLLFKQGADCLVAGSYVFKNGSDSYLKQIDSLRQQ